MAMHLQDTERRSRIEFTAIVLFATFVLTSAYIAAGAFLMEQANTSAPRQMAQDGRSANVAIQLR